ncbi:GTP-binding protein [Podila humilis]|nr:GTP-binding protein [Podila humilis]
MIESPFSRLDAVIFVYDVTSHQSFERVLDYWHPRIHHYPGQIRILVGNKVDCASNSGREVSRQSGQDLADTLGILFFETSAILNIGVDDVFTTMARALKKDRVERDRRDRVASAVTLNNTVSNPLRLGCWR